MSKFTATIASLCTFGSVILAATAASAGWAGPRTGSVEYAVPAFYPYPYGYALPVRPGVLAPVVSGGYYYTGRRVYPVVLPVDPHIVVRP